jgi:hypothetical protein
VVARAVGTPTPGILQKSAQRIENARLAFSINAKSAHEYHSKGLEVACFQ